MVYSNRNGRYFGQYPSPEFKTRHYVGDSICFHRQGECGNPPVVLFSNSQSLTLVQFQLSVFTHLYAAIMLGKLRLLRDANAWLAALWLAGERSTSQWWGKWLPVYWHSVHRTPHPNDIPKRALKHLPLSFVSFLVRLLNSIFRMQYFRPAWKHASLTSTLKPGKKPGLTLFYRPISLLDTVGKLTRS